MTSSVGIIGAIQAADTESVRILLAENPALASARDESGVTAIMHALYRRQPEIIEILLASNHTLDIFEASSLGRANHVSELLRQDPRLVSAWSPDGFTPLHFACFFGQEKVASLLLERGAQADAVARNAMQVKPIHSCVAARSMEILTRLLAHGASPNVRQQQGWTPLHSAAQHGDQAMVELLLQHGADRDAASEDGATPIQLAAQKGHDEIVKLLTIL